MAKKKTASARKIAKPGTATARKRGVASRSRSTGAAAPSEAVLVEVATEQATPKRRAPKKGNMPRAGASAERQRQRLLPLGEELKSLYARYTAGAKFDEHDKAFYFVLDVGGVSRAKQLLAHVQEVLEELEEFR